ncbi:hypothetical protein [Streptomyces sp. NPDC047706]|uniref:hypothetical protein n=1 Tax=Streptomyces sp. NPDC047706 TaxID=3365486 RepID=UPI00371A462E
MRRPVTPVTRDFGRVLSGLAPAEPLPPAPEPEPAAFVVRDQRGFWPPAVRRAGPWTRDAWADGGLTTLAWATVALREGRLISGREAPDAQPALGAPAAVVEDIRERRCGNPAPPAPERTVRRGELTRSYLGPAIDAPVAAYS